MFPNSEVPITVLIENPYLSAANADQRSAMEAYFTAITDATKLTKIVELSDAIRGDSKPQWTSVSFIDFYALFIGGEWASSSEFARILESALEEYEKFKREKAEALENDVQMADSLQDVTLNASTPNPAISNSMTRASPTRASQLLSPLLTNTPMLRKVQSYTDSRRHARDREIELARQQQRRHKNLHQSQTFSVDIDPIETVATIVPVKTAKIGWKRKWTGKNATMPEFYAFQDEALQHMKGLTAEKDKVDVLRSGLDPSVVISSDLLSGRRATTVESIFNQLLRQVDGLADHPNRLERQWTTFKQGKLPWDKFFQQSMDFYWRYVGSQPRFEGWTEDELDAWVYDEKHIDRQKEAFNNLLSCMDPFVKLQAETLMDSYPGTAVLIPNIAKLSDVTLKLERLEAVKNSKWPVVHDTVYATIDEQPVASTSRKRTRPNECKYGLNCFREQCRYEHPQGHDPVKARSDFESKRRGEGEQRNATRPFG